MSQEQAAKTSIVSEVRIQVFSIMYMTDHAPSSWKSTTLDG